jgi:transcriptional regulator with XRE-family HTH domain
MERTDLTVAELRERMLRKGIPMTALAQASGIWATELSQLLRGTAPLGPVRRARLEAAIHQLGLDQPVSEDDAAARGPVFHTGVAS